MMARDTGDGDPKLMKVLKIACQMADDPRVRAGLLFQVAEQCKCSELPFLTERAISDPEEDIRQMTLQVLAEYCHEDPATVAFVVDRFSNDSDPGMRQMCLWEMASRWGDHPLVIPLVSGALRLKG
jgi:hypothetical protein